MSKLKTLFQQLPQNQLSPEAEERIFTSFRSAQERITKRNLYLSISGIFFSLTCLGTGATFFIKSLLESEFWTFVQLFFSDLSVVSSNSTEFLFSLLETVPVLPLAILFLSLSIFFWSGGFLLSLRRNNFVSFSRLTIAK